MCFLVAIDPNGWERWVRGVLQADGTHTDDELNPGVFISNKDRLRCEIVQSEEIDGEQRRRWLASDSGTDWPEDKVRWRSTIALDCFCIKMSR